MLKKTENRKQKRGALILVEASKRKSFLDNAKSIVKNFFATIGGEYKKELFVVAVNEKEAILKQPDVLEKAFKLGERLIL